MAALLPTEKQVYGAQAAVTSIDFEGHSVTLANGTIVRYRSLISTIPLDTTLTWLGRADLARRLTHSSTHIIGLGLRGVCPHDTKCWLYYPEDNCPFYRCTVFSHYAAANCPAEETSLPTIRLASSAASGATAAKPGPYWSLMFEVSESSQFKPVNLHTVVEDTIQGAIATQLVASTDEIVSIYHT